VQISPALYSREGTVGRLSEDHLLAPGAQFATFRRRWCRIISTHRAQRPYETVAEHLELLDRP
jgi:hypothetical protein